jgi:NAD(P)-dependent dehydrogenase (short-subunit alcohol dehydrogenase family)
MSKVWFVTGANSGIVTAALEADNQVVAIGRSLDRLRATFPDNGSEALALAELDVTDAAQATTAIEDYAAQGSAQDAYAAYNCTQFGDPLRLSEALLAINAMEQPPKLFAAGSDAVDMLKPAAEARLSALEDNFTVSRSTDGVR